jgi:hypothetical protein
MENSHGTMAPVILVEKMLHAATNFHSYIAFHTIVVIFGCLEGQISEFLSSMTHT